MHKDTDRIHHKKRRWNQPPEDVPVAKPEDGVHSDTVYHFVGKPFKWWWVLARPVRTKILIAFFLTMVSMSMMTIGATIAGWFVDDVYGKGETSKIFLYCAILVAVPVIRSILGLGYRYIYEITSHDILIRLRVGLYKHLQTMDGPFYDKTSIGDLMARMTGDLEMIRHFTAYILMASLEQFLIFTIGTLYIFSINWVLALTALAFSPFIIWITTCFSKEIRPIWDQVRKQFSGLNAVVQQNISGNRVIKAFVRADYETEKFEKQNKDFHDINLKSVSIWVKYIPALDGLANFLTIPVILVGGILVIKGQMTLGGLVAFNGMLFVISNPMRMVGGLVNEVQRYAASAEKLIELLIQKPSVSSKDHSIHEEVFENPEAVVFENVSFQYFANKVHQSSSAKPQKETPRVTLEKIGKVAKETYEKLSKIDLRDKNHSPEDIPLDKTESIKDASVVAKEEFIGDENSYVLKNISFTVRKGETIGIIGATGSGKSSLVNLIMRFYDTTKGRILINGKNIRDYSIQDLRKHIGIVMQEVFLFSDTVEGNIAYGNVSASIDDVVGMAGIAQADRFIQKMPQSYDTIIGERGVGLSGGQRQRIALARAICMNPSILILDDTTSAIDMETEFEIQKGLDEFFSDRTVFIVAHRISSVRKADQIIVLDKGQIAEIGKHEELIAKKGIYYDVYMMQSGLIFDQKTEDVRQESNQISDSQLSDNTMDFPSGNVRLDRGGVDVHGQE